MPIITFFIIALIKFLQVVLTKQRRINIKEYEEIKDIQYRVKIQELAKIDLAKENDEYRKFINTEK